MSTLPASLFPPLDFRGSNFIASFASEAWGTLTIHGQGLQAGAVDKALRDVELQAAQLAHAGVNVVRLFLSYCSYKWWHKNDPTNGVVTFKSYLQGICQRFARHGIRVLPTFGNTFGEDPLKPDTYQPQAFEDLWTLGQGAPLPSQRVLLVNDLWPGYPGSTLWFQEPGYGLTVAIDPYTPGFVPAFFSSWFGYVVDIATTLNGEQNVVAWELYNEPDHPAHYTPGIAVAIELTRVGIRYVDSARPLVLGAGSPDTMMTLGLSLAQFSSTPLDPYGYYRDYITWFGFHLQNHEKVAGAEALAPSGTNPAEYPGYPPKSDFKTDGLQNGPGSPGDLSLVFNFLTDPVTGETRSGFVEESCIRVAFPQLFHDLDLACRSGTSHALGSRSLGLFMWNVEHSGAGMMTHGGPACVGREHLSMRNRYLAADRLHLETQITPAFTSIQTGSSSSGRIFVPAGSPTPPTSQGLRPLILQSGSTTLLIAADAFDDVPVNADHRAYPASAYSSRNKIWACAIRQGRSTGFVDLETVRTGGSPVGLLALSGDLKFRDIDDNVNLTLGNPPLAAMPFKLGVFNPGGIANWNFPSGGQPSLYPAFEVPIDPTWGFSPAASSSKIPTVSIAPCTSGWSSWYVQDLPSLETELMVRPYLVTRARQAYAGVTGRVVGVGRPPTGSPPGETGRFLLALHRTVPKAFQSGPSGESYGPEEDARTGGPAGSDLLKWSANYGSFFRRTPVVTNATGEPEKHEIVLVSVEVTPDAQQNPVMAATAWVHPTRGWYLDGHSAPGASARDPVLAANDNGDIVMVYQLTQDPFFRFDLRPIPTSYSQTVNAVGAQTGECSHGTPPPTVPFQTILNLPLNHKNDWQSFVTDSRWNRFYTETVAEVWMAGTTAFGGQKLVCACDSPPRPATYQRLTEPYSPNTMSPFFYCESANAFLWREGQKDLVQYGGTPYLMLLDSTKLAFLTNKQFIASTPSVPADDLHAWLPSVSPQIAVGRRQADGKISVFVLWKQIPYARRSDFVKYSTAQQFPWPCYAVYGLRLVGEIESGASRLCPAPAVTAYETFGSKTDMGNGSLSANNWSITTWDEPAVNLQPAGNSSDPATRDAASALVFWQRRTDLYASQEGQTVLPANAKETVTIGNQAGLMTPRSALEPRRGLFASNDTTLRVTAWLAPAGTKMRVKCETEMQTRGLPAVVQTIQSGGGNYETSDPRARIVAVVPFVKPIQACTPPRDVAVARIVWQADDDVWVADVPYECQAPTVQRASSVTSGAGYFPTLTTEVSVSGRTILWTHDGQMHAIHY